MLKELYGRITSLSYQDAVVSVVGAALVTHLIFNRTETHEPVYLALLLLALPATFTASLAPHSSSLISAAATTFVLFWASLVTSIVVYRLSPWHPLASFPGPLLYKVSKLPIAFLSLRGKQHKHFRELHKRYGDIVRVGPNELSIVDAAAIQPLMGPNGLPKGPWWDGRFSEFEPVKPLAAIRDKTEHTRRRRPWTRAFSSAALKNYEDIITSRCVQLVETIGCQDGAVDLNKWISYFAYDVMNDLAFGGGTEMIRDGDVDGLWHLLEAGEKIALFMSHVPWLGALFFRYPYLATDLKAFRAYAKTQASNRRKNGSPRKDLFHYLIDEAGVSVTPPSMAEVVSDGVTAILAGSDTTSTSITNLFFLLLSNPKKYQRLRAEIDQLGSEIMDYGNQAQLPYLNAAINESLRLHPPVLSGSQRYTNPGSGGRLIGDKYIPECTTVFMPHYVLHRDPRHFYPLPDAFVPERWLALEEQIKLEPEVFKNQEDVTLNSSCFMPFSLGPSNCVGKTLAWMEMRMAICLLVKKYDMKFADGYNPEEWEANMFDYFVTMRGELHVMLTPRR